jgi:putative endonuclease
VGLAVRHLRGLGLKELHRNYLCRGGEIDSIMQEKATLVFIEVRYRRSGLYGGACETLGTTKKAHLLRAASHYLLSRREGVDAPCRFDLVTVEASRTPRRSSGSRRRSMQEVSEESWIASRV